jgi:5-methylcytosine-specific restriction endonuclease McrA
VSYHRDWSFKPPLGSYVFTKKKSKKKPSKAQKRKWKAIEKYKKLKKKYPGILDKDFYRTPEWLALRYKVLRAYGGRCQLCGARGGNSVVLHVDHIKPRSKYPQLALEFNNMQVLCESCNLGKGNSDSTDWRGLDYDEQLPEGAIEHMKAL